MKRGLLILAVAIVAITGPAVVGADEHLVPATFATLEAALVNAAVAPGDTITVTSGNYDQIYQDFDTRDDGLLIRSVPAYACTLSNATSNILLVEDDGTWESSDLVWEGIVFSGTGNAGGVELASTNSWTFNNCIWTGDWDYPISVGAGSNKDQTDSLTFNNCQFNITNQNWGVKPGILFNAPGTNLTFNNTSFDYSGAGTITSGSQPMLDIMGMSGADFINCTFTSPNEMDTAGVMSYIMARDAGAPTGPAGDIDFFNCTFTGPSIMDGVINSALILLKFEDGVDSCDVIGSTFTSAAGSAQNVNGVKWENGDGSGGDPNATSGSAISNTFNGLRISVGFLEHSVGLVASGNRINGQGGTDSDGIYFQDAQDCTATNNWVSNCRAGFRSTNGDRSPTFENARNRVVGNFIQGNTYAYFADTGDFDAWLVGGNILHGNTNVGSIDFGVTPITSLATWQTQTVPDLAAEAPGHYMSLGDVLFSDYPGALRGAGSVPRGWGKLLGSRNGLTN